MLATCLASGVPSTGGFLYFGCERLLLILVVKDLFNSVDSEYLSYFFILKFYSVISSNLS